MLTRPARRGGRLVPLLLFAGAAYGPLLATQPGWLSADTKTYLYLDPGRLLGRAWSLWDPNVGLGTVTHQTVGYLWPMGPWFWALDALGVPDWVAQRLWWGTLVLAAGTGVVALARRLGWTTHAVWVAATAYAFSPYLLTHLGRLSGVLLPFAGLPWLLWATIGAERRGGWRHPALFALILATVGSVNLTALVLVGVVPVAWLLHAAASGATSPRRALAAAGRIAVLTVPVSAWWIAGLSVQASHGIDVVRYSETAEVVATTSTATEVLRGLGYWFFYGGDRIDPWVMASTDYTQRPWVVAASFAVPVLALAAAAVLRWRHRGIAVVLVTAGTVLAVGAHPWDDPPPLGRLVAAVLDTQRGLALRSLTRAVPVVALGLALLLGAAVTGVVRRRPRAAWAVPLLAALPVVALVPHWERTTVSTSLRRQEVPGYWREAIVAADAGDAATRVLALPGSDFAYYRWGATVDPIEPGLMDRPYVARELIPQGSPPGADLLVALDDRLHERTLDPEALAPVARLLRVGDVLVRSDLQYERFELARPRLVWALVAAADGLGQPQPFGPPTPNEPHPLAQLHDEVWLLTERRLDHPPPVALVPVADPVPIVSLKPAHATVVLSGDGDGIVDAAAAGLLTGHELVRYSASLDPDERAAALEDAALVVVTDTNRRRAERWRSVHDRRGFTERPGEALLVEDPADQRLPVFPGAPADTETVVEHRGGVHATATSYGDSGWYAPEWRPSAAVDGDPGTAWRAANDADPRGERLVLTLDEPRPIDRLRILQPAPVPGRPERWITRLVVTVGRGARAVVELDERSRTAPGQLVTVPEVRADHVELEVAADTASTAERLAGAGPVGLAEVAIDDDPALVADEVVRLPGDLLEHEAVSDRPLAVVLTRLRTDPTRAGRDDEERALVRAFRTTGAHRFELAGAVRLSGRAADAVLDRLLGQEAPGLAVSGTARLAGSRAERPVAALDGDLTTAWTSARGVTAGAALRIEAPEVRTFDDVVLHVVADGAHSVPTSLDVSVDGQVVAQVAVDPIADRPEPGATVAVPVPMPAVAGRVLELRVTAAREVTSTDRPDLAPLAHPVAVAEVDLPGLRVPAAPATLDTGCRDDLLELDGAPVPVRVTGDVDDALGGAALSLTGCGPVAIGPGEHLLRAAPGLRTGLDLDRLVLGEGLPPITTAPARDQPVVRSSAPDRLEVDLPAGAARDGAWLVLGQSHNDGWRATLDGHDLGEPTLVDGFANGWRLPPGTDAATVSLRFAPQRRVDLALVVSALAALLALVLVWRSPGPATWAPDPPPDADWPGLGTADRGWRAAVGLGAACGLGAALVLPPAGAVVVALAAASAARWRAARVVLRLAPAGLVATGATWVVLRQVRDPVPHGLGWPSALPVVHTLGVLAVVLLLVSVVVERGAVARGSATDGAGP